MTKLDAFLGAALTTLAGILLLGAGGLALFVLWVAYDYWKELLK